MRLVDARGEVMLLESEVDFNILATRPANRHHGGGALSFAGPAHTRGVTLGISLSKH